MTYRCTAPSRGPAGWRCRRLACAVWPSAAELVSQLTLPLPALTIFALLGLPDADAEQPKPGARKNELTWGRPSPQYQRRAATNMIAFWDLASELLTRRQGDPDGLSDHEIAAVVFSLSFS